MLLSFERVFDAANGVLNPAFDLVGPAVRLQLGVTDRSAGRLFDGAFVSFAGPTTRSLSMLSSSRT